MYLTEGLSIKDFLTFNNIKDLRDADLSYVYLRDADLRCADLSGVDLRCTDLIGANLSGAKLIGADLNYADLRCANLSGANLDFTSMPFSCKGLNWEIDKRLAVQIAYHFCSMYCNDEETIKMQNLLIDFANQFHRTDVSRLKKKENAKN